MSMVYEIEKRLEPAVDLVLDTLLNHCVGGLRLEHTADNTILLRFNVSEEDGGVV
jgi:hypothetical protein